MKHIAFILCCFLFTHLSGQSVGNVLKWNGFAYVPGTDLNTGNADSAFYNLTGKAITGFTGKRHYQKLWRQGPIIIGKNVLTNTSTLDTAGTLVLYPRSSFDGGTQAAIKVISADADAVVDFGNSNMYLKGPGLKIESTSNTYVTNILSGVDTWAWRYGTSPFNSFQLYNETDGTNPINVSTAALSNTINIDNSSNVDIGAASSLGKLNIYQSANATGVLLSLENTGGSNQIYRSAASPETVITCDNGDLVLTPLGTYGKYTGNTTGYAKYSGTLFTQTADKTVTNTTTETSIIGTGVGILTLPSGFFIAGRSIRIKLSGILTTPATPGNVLIKVKLGSTVIASATTSNFVSNAVTDVFDFETIITCRTTGGSGTVMSNGLVTYQGPSGLFSDAVHNAGATATVATNTSQALTVTIQWDTADTGKTIKITTGIVEVIN